MSLARVTAEIEVEVPGQWSGADAVDVLLEKARARLGASAVTLTERSPRLATVFEQASPHLSLSEAELSRIVEHRNRLILKKSVPRAGVEVARDMVQAVAELLEVPGSLGVHVKSAGKAHGPREWSHIASGHPFDLFRAFVVIGYRERYRSWGMKNLGLPDATLVGDMFPATASALLQSMLIDQIEHPVRPLEKRWRLGPGIDPEVEVRWAITRPEDNPFGVHILEPVS